MPERIRRLRLAQGVFAALRGYWSSDTPWKQKRVVFQGAVVATLFSAVKAFVMSPTDYQAFDRYVLAKGRAFMQGKATTKLALEGGGIQYRYRGDQVVWDFLQIAPAIVEMTIARVRFYVSLLEEPRHREQFWTVFLATYPFEQHE
eukprot:7432135-Alexandrium_andersonii.AAC.1